MTFHDLNPRKKSSKHYGWMLRGFAAAARMIDAATEGGRDMHFIEYRSIGLMRCFVHHAVAARIEAGHRRFAHLLHSDGTHANDQKGRYDCESHAVSPD
jgi:hypothetical protein